MKFLITLLSLSAFAIPTCQERVFCTREYKPTICKANDLVARGNNKCQARAKLFKSLCAQGVTDIAQEDFQCRPSRGESLINTCQPPRPCTREYRPQICSVPGHPPVRGANRCNARQKLLRQLCNQGIKSVKGPIICKRPGLQTNCQERVFCTQEFKPTTCFAQGVHAFGTNKCKAKQKVRQKLCSMGNTNIGEIQCRTRGGIPNFPPITLPQI